MRKQDIAWDDPEQYPEDEEDGMSPQDPPHTTVGVDLTIPTELGAGKFQPDEDRRAAIRRRRRFEIDNMIATQEYRERRKHELREERGGRFA